MKRSRRPPDLNFPFPRAPLITELGAGCPLKRDYGTSLPPKANLLEPGKPVFTWTINFWLNILSKFPEAIRQILRTMDVRIYSSRRKR
jgi:hypothetical protein